MLLKELRQEVINTGIRLHDYGLITLTGGNVSARDTESGLVVITPSGMEYNTLSPEDVVVVDVDGKVVEGVRKPSSDLITHLQIYKAKDWINSIIHTHSSYASCFAVLNEPIPVISTTMANEVGGEVPVAPYAPVTSEKLGDNIIKCIQTQQAVLLESHGVFTFGQDVHHALVSAVMLEDAAKVYYLARTIGQPEPLSKDEVERANALFRNQYGQ